MPVATIPKPSVMVAQKEGEERADAPNHRVAQQTPTILLRRASCWAVLIVELAQADEMMQGQPSDELPATVDTTAAQRRRDYSS